MHTILARIITLITEVTDESSILVMETLSKVLVVSLV